MDGTMGPFSLHVDEFVQTQQQPGILDQGFVEIAALGYSRCRDESHRFTPLPHARQAPAGNPVTEIDGRGGRFFRGRLQASRESSRAAMHLRMIEEYQGLRWRNRAGPHTMLVSVSGQSNTCSIGTIWLRFTVK